MPKLTVTIITKNEEQKIERCINSVRTIADEIVVVDSHSTDRTVEICKRLGAKVTLHDFDGYIEQKNFALTQASNELIFSIDADEALSDALKSSILKAKEQGNADGYTMNRLTNYCGQWIHHCGWYPDVKLRLFSRKASWGGTNPHDKIVLPAGSKVLHLEGDLLHYSYDTLNDHIEQIKRFTEIGAREAYVKGIRSSVLKIFVKTSVKFFRDYVLKLGFLDGFYGFVICSNSTYATFLKYVRIRMLQQQK